MYAINDSSLCIGKGNKIVIWGSNENGILGKEKNVKDPKNRTQNLEFISKTDFTEIINNTILKENLDYGNAFINSRKLFNTKFNQIKRDNMIKRIHINDLEERKKSCIEDAHKNVAKNVFYI